MLNRRTTCFEKFCHFPNQGFWLRSVVTNRNSRARYAGHQKFIGKNKQPIFQSGINDPEEYQLLFIAWPYNITRFIGVRRY